MGQKHYAFHNFVSIYSICFLFSSSSLDFLLCLRRFPFVLLCLHSSVLVLPFQHLQQYCPGEANNGINRNVLTMMSNSPNHIQACNRLICPWASLLYSMKADLKMVALGKNVTEIYRWRRAF